MHKYKINKNRNPYGEHCGHCERCHLLEQQPLHQFGEVVGSYGVTVHWEKGWEGAETLLIAMTRSEGETNLATEIPDAENRDGDIIIMVAGT